MYMYGTQVPTNNINNATGRTGHWEWLGKQCSNFINDQSEQASLDGEGRLCK